MTVTEDGDHWARLKIEGLAPAGRGGHCCAAINAKVIIFGGADRAPTPYGDLHCLELGDPEPRMWTQVQPRLAAGVQLHSLSGASLTVINAVAYMFGGQDPTTGVCSSHVLKLDPASWTWSLVQPASGGPPPRHSHCAGALHGNCILVYGGASQNNSMFGDVWVFNVDSREWSRVDVAGAAPAAREMATGTMLDAARMLVFGGRSADGAVLADMAVLDMSRCAWRQHAGHRFARCAHSACLLPRDAVAPALLERLESRRLQASREDTRAAVASGPAQPGESASGVSEDDAPVVAMFAGFTGDEVVSDVVLVDSGTMTCVRAGPGKPDDKQGVPAARFAHTAIAIQGGEFDKAMLVFGGVNPSKDLNDVYVWRSCVT